MSEDLDKDYLTLLPKYNPEPVFIFAHDGSIVFQNNSSKKILSEIKKLTDICEYSACNLDSIIGSNKIKYISYSRGEKTYLLALVGSKSNNLALAYGFNITEAIEGEKRLKQQFITDSLTGLSNRNKLVLDLEEKKQEGVLLLIDINNFGEINSFYGYKKGDVYLQKTAKKLIELFQTCGDKTALFRLNGDVFALLLENNNSYEKALDTAKLITDAFHKTQIDVDNVNIGVEVSIGIATTLDAKRKDLLNLSEIALSEGKKRNRSVTKYEDVQDVQEKYKENLFWAGKIKEILNGKSNAQIVSFFQPIYNLENGKIEKFETLVRIEDGEEIIPPFKFLEPASKLGLLPKITDAMLESACKKFANTNYEFSINLTKQDLEREELLEVFQNILNKYSVNANSVVLEVLEDERTFDKLDVINQLKEVGFKIAIDDFGIGYSNFKRAQAMNADYIKIDGSLIKDLKNSDKDLPIVKAIVTYAKSNGAKTIAEFVSSKEIYEKLENMGVDYLQGFYIGAPSPDIEIAFIH